MPNPLAGGTALAPNCGFEGGAPVAGDLLFGTRDAGPTAARCATMSQLKTNMLLRSGIFWGTVDPGNDGSGFSFGNLDSKLAGRNGMRFLFCMKGGGSVAANSYPGPGNVANYAACAAAIVDRYSAPALWGIEFYNEPDLAGWTGAQVGQVANAAANACAVANARKPAAQRIKLLAGTWSGGPNMASDARVGQFYDTINGNSNIDMISWHPYHHGRPPEAQSLNGGSGPWQTYAQSMINFAAAHGWHGNFASTEYNTTTDPGHPITVTEKHNAQWLIRQNIMMLAHSGGKFRAFFQFEFFGGNEGGWPSGCGILRSAVDVADNGTTPGAGTPKPLYEAYQTFLHIFDEGYSSCTPVLVSSSTSASPFKYRYDKTGGRYGFVFWTALEGATTNHILTGLPASVRKTSATWSGINLSYTQSVVQTSGGSLTLPATNDVTYVDAVW